MCPCCFLTIVRCVGVLGRTSGPRRAVPGGTGWLDLLWNCLGRCGPLVDSHQRLCFVFLPLPSLAVNHPACLRAWPLYLRPRSPVVWCVGRLVDGWGGIGGGEAPLANMMLDDLHTHNHARTHPHAPTPTHPTYPQHVTMGGGRWSYHPTHIWTPSGGWFPNTKNWRANTLVALGVIGLAAFSTFSLSASLEVRFAAGCIKRGKSQERTTMRAGVGARVCTWVDLGRRRLELPPSFLSSIFPSILATPQLPPTPSHARQRTHTFNRDDPLHLPGTFPPRPGASTQRRTTSRCEQSHRGGTLSRQATAAATGSGA